MRRGRLFVRAIPALASATVFFFLNLEQAPSLKPAEGRCLRLWQHTSEFCSKTCQRCNTKKVRFGKNGHVQVSFKPC